MFLSSKMYELLSLKNLEDSAHIEELIEDSV